MKHLYLAALAALCVSPLPAHAETAAALLFEGTDITFRSLPEGTTLLSVATKGRGKAAAVQASARSSGRQPVLVDGVLIEMDEEMIRALIRAGIFTIVYPGTNIPWSEGGTHVPNYPPDWLRPSL
jgi:hypothetical protein